MGPAQQVTLAASAPLTPSDNLRLLFRESPECSGLKPPHESGRGAPLEWGAGSRKLEGDRESNRGKASISSVSSVGLMLIPGEWTVFLCPACFWPRSLLTCLPAP